MLHLESAGERRYNTKTREAIIALLAREQRYLTAAAVHRLLRTAKSKVSLSTVYRTLDLLAQTGFASARIDSGGEMSFHYCNPSHHHHAICTKCGRVEEIDCFPLAALADQLMEEHAFALQSHAMEFHGICARCQ